MIFVYSNWEKFCNKLAEKGLNSVTAKSITEKSIEGNYIVLKHDVETNVSSAYEIAKIENKYGHCGSYYVQAYLMEEPKNILLLKKMAAMGHEISYHHDVMDFSKGKLETAIKEYDKNVALFENNGFKIRTVCQHGNPVIERVGYSSNRDFFRSNKVQALYPNTLDIMVNFKEKINTDYEYFSDAGRKFKMIYDPINNDIINSDDKNIPFDNLDDLLKYINGLNKSSIISIHPHRWTSSACIYVIKDLIFKIIKKISKLLLHIPFMKKIMGKYYYLAKKI